jgi:hypothetical protein
MNDLKLLKEQHDLRLIVEADLGPAHCRGGKALLWRCPFHNEHKGYSLAVWEDGWRCFGACGAKGDVLDWLQRYRGLSFTEACEYLGQTTPPSEPAMSIARNLPPILHAKPNRQAALGRKTLRKSWMALRVSCGVLKANAPCSISRNAV